MPLEALPGIASMADATMTLETAAAAAVLDAVLKADSSATGEDLAQAERSAGILFDAASVEAAVSAAREQALAECRADIAEAQAQLALMAGSRRQVMAVLRLCEGRLGDDLLLVSAVAVAAECGTTAFDGLPMRLSWDGSVDMAEATDPVKAAIVHCDSSYGGRAELIVEGDDRLALARLLDAEVRTVDGACKEKGCGSTEDLDASDPMLFGWTRIEVAGVGGEPRWYCSTYCVTTAFARAAEELAVMDDMAAAGGDL
jgi:hypothetical protein